MSRFRASAIATDYILAETPLHLHSNWSLLVLPPLWLKHHNGLLAGTIVGLLKPENFSKLEFELFSHFRLSRYIVLIPYQSSSSLFFDSPLIARILLTNIYFSCSIFVTEIVFFSKCY